MEEAKDAVLKNAGTASVNGQIQVARNTTSIDAATAAVLSNNVVEIVKTVTTGLAHTRDICVTLIGRNPNVTPSPGTALAACIHILENGLPEEPAIDKF